MVIALANLTAWASSQGRILKVLPHFLDAEGRVSLAPSLFQRDAYQARLRQHPELVSSVRYDVNCKTARSSRKDLKLRLTLRTALRAETDPLVLESTINGGVFRRSWQSIQLEPAVYRAAGAVLAWRVELLEGTNLVATQQSFLW